MLEVYSDGASRSNPGYAAAGISIYEAGELIYKTGIYLGKVSNNQAEYMALINALEIAKLHGREAKCYSDSQLMISQLKGLYKLKNINLIELHKRVKELEKNFDRIEYTHVLRSHPKIKEVDRLANIVLDDRHGRHTNKD